MVNRASSDKRRSRKYSSARLASASLQEQRQHTRGLTAAASDNERYEAASNSSCRSAASDTATSVTSASGSGSSTGCSCSSITLIGEHDYGPDCSSLPAAARSTQQDGPVSDRPGCEEQQQPETMMTTLPENDECWLTQNISFPQPSESVNSDRRRALHQIETASRQFSLTNSVELQPQPLQHLPAAPASSNTCAIARFGSVDAAVASSRPTVGCRETLACEGGGASIEAPSATSAVMESSVISRTVFVPQNWTSIIFFVKGSEAEAIARQCRVDLSVSCCSVNCSKREKEILGTARKRAVHIRAACVEDAASTVEQLLAAMPVLVSHPDLPERSWLIKDDPPTSTAAAAAATGAGGDGLSSAQSTYVPPTAQSQSQSQSQSQLQSQSLSQSQSQPQLLSDSDPAGQLQSTQSESVGAATSASVQDARSYCSRRQLHEFRPAILEVDVENTSSGLLPFFPGSCDRRGSVVSARSGCTIEITDRVRRRPGGEERRVLRVLGPNMSALEKCARLLELHFPNMGARNHFKELRDRLDVGVKQLRFA